VGATSLSIPAPPASAALTEQIEGASSAGVLILWRDSADSTPEFWLGARVYTPEIAVTYTP